MDDILGEGLFIDEDTMEMILIFDMDGTITYVNERGVEVMGYFEDEFLDMNITDILPPDQVEKIKQEILSKYNNGDKGVAHQEAKFIDRNLKMLSMEVSASLITKDNTASGIRIIARDVEEPEKGIAEEPEPKPDISAPKVPRDIPEPRPVKETGKSEPGPRKKIAEPGDKYRLVTEAVRDMLLTFDMSGRITYMNERGREMIGYSEEELPNINITDILSPEQLGILKKQLFRKPIARNRKVLIPEARFANRRLKQMSLEVTASLIMKRGTPSEVVILARDLTRRKKMEKELLKSQKFESFATLASGLVDDLNNSLTGIMGNIDLAQMDSASDGRVSERLAYAKEGCTNLKHLIRQFIIFSKGGTANREIGSIEELIKDSVPRGITGPNVVSDFFIETDLWTVAYDKAQMKEVINNLIFNAGEAMPSGGQIKIYAENITGAVARKEAGLPMEEGDYVKISVQDRGAGIREEHLGRIFDPYFSTKKKGGDWDSLLSIPSSKSITAIFMQTQSQGPGQHFTFIFPRPKKKSLAKKKQSWQNLFFIKGKSLSWMMRTSS